MTTNDYNIKYLDTSQLFMFQKHQDETIKEYLDGFSFALATGKVSGNVIPTKEGKMPENNTELFHMSPDEMDKAVDLDAKMSEIMKSIKDLEDLNIKSAFQKVLGPPDNEAPSMSYDTNVHETTEYIDPEWNMLGHTLSQKMPKSKGEPRPYYLKTIAGLDYLIAQANWNDTAMHLQIPLLIDIPGIGRNRPWGISMDLGGSFGNLHLEKKVHSLNGGSTSYALIGMRHKLNSPVSVAVVSANYLDSQGELVKIDSPIMRAIITVISKHAKENNS